MAAFRLEPAQRKWEILKIQRCFPPKKKENGGGSGETRHHQTKKNTISTHKNSTKKRNFWLWNKPPQKNHRGKIPQVFMEKNLQLRTPNLQKLLQGFLCERIILLFLEKWRRPLLSDKNQRWDVGEIWWKDDEIWWNYDEIEHICKNMQRWCDISWFIMKHWKIWKLYCRAVTAAMNQEPHVTLRNCNTIPPYTPNNCNVSQQNTCLVYLKYTSTQASPWFTYNSMVEAWKNPIRP